MKQYKFIDRFPEIVSLPSPVDKGGTTNVNYSCTNSTVSKPLDRYLRWQRAVVPYFIKTIASSSNMYRTYLLTKCFCVVCVSCYIAFGILFSDFHFKLEPNMYLLIYHLSYHLLLACANRLHRLLFFFLSPEVRLIDLVLSVVDFSYICL